MVATIVLALVVALISASAGLAQATLGVSGVGVAARQRAVDAELALLREVVDRLAALSAGLTGAIRKNRVIDDEAAARLDTALQRAYAVMHMAGPRYSGYAPTDNALSLARRYLSPPDGDAPVPAVDVLVALDQAISEFGADVQAGHARLMALAQGPTTRAIARFRR